MTKQIPETILNQYNIGEIENIRQISVGLIHQTYKITTNNGEFILQKLHPLLSSEEIAKDFHAVTEHLAKHNFSAPKVVLNIYGEVNSKDRKDRWRMQTALLGDSKKNIENAEMAMKTGKMYADFHKVLDSIEHEFKTDMILHDTKHEYQKFEEALKDYSELTDNVEAEIGFIQKEMPQLYLPESLPKRVIHGDPQSTNILFVDNESSGVIDLDTCNRNTILVDIGDMFRSWCMKENSVDGENADVQTQKETSQISFDLEIFKAGWGGYINSADFLTLEEKKYYFEDSYFGWDDSHYKSRREHNLVRSRQQIELYKDIALKEDEIDLIVTNT